MLSVSLILFALAVWSASCNQAQEAPAPQSLIIENAPDSNFIVSGSGDTVFTGIPIPAKGKRIDPDSVAPPRVVPLKGRPKVTPAHPNVYPAGKPKEVPVPKELTVIIPGQDGVPMPETVPARGKVVPAIQTKPVPALPPIMDKSALADISYLDVEQGMSGSFVRSILEDSQGNLWFGTWENGVSRYDGIRFAHFTTREGLSYDRVWAILEDSRGNIWFGTMGGGLSSYDGVNFTHYTEEAGLSGKEVHAMLEDSRQNLWFATNNGVSRYDPGLGENGTFTHYSTKEGLSGNIVLSMMEDRRGSLWFGTYSSGVTRFEPAENGSGGVFTQYSKKDGLSDNRIQSMAEDRQGNLWFGTWDGGVCRYDGNNFALYNVEQGLSNNRIRSIVTDSQGNLWFGTLGGGVSRFDGTDFIRYSVEEGLSDPYIEHIMEDSRGNLWFATKSGVNRFNGSRFSHYPTEEGLGNVMSIQEDRQGNLWYAILFGGATRYDGTNFIHYTTEEGLSSNIVTSLLEDKHGNIWFGTYDGGVNRFDGKNFTHYTEEGGLRSNFTPVVVEDDRGDLWFGAGSGKVVHYNQKEIDQEGLGSFTHFTTQGRGGVQAMVTDKQGNIWIAPIKGTVSKYDGENFTHYTTKEGLNGYSILCMMADSWGDVWLGTDGGGISRFDGQKFTHYTEEDGLGHNSVKSILEDKQKNIWIGTSKGITLLTPLPDKTSSIQNIKDRKYRFIIFDKRDGIKVLNFNPGVCLDRQNRIWWGTDNGLTMLDLNEFKLPTIPPEIRLNNIDVVQTFVDYRRLSDSAYQHSLAFGKPLSASFDSVAPFRNYPVTMTLPHHLDQLTFHFSAIDWAAPHKLQYSYTMEGSDEAWSPLSPESKADYRNLPPGRYTFKVKAIGAAGVWSDVFEYPFRIRPPWWANWWAYLLYGLLGLYLLYQIYLFLLNHQLEQAEIVRLQELDDFKTRLYTNITHEFRTPLTIILGMARQIKDDPKKWFDEGLQMIGRNGRQLLGLVEQMLDLSKLDKGKLTLNLQRGEVVGFIRYLVQSFESYAAGKHIQLHFLKEVERLEMDFDPDQLTKVVSNLLSNALKFTPEDGNVYVSARHQTSNAGGTQGILELRVRDTGPGIPAEELPRIFDRFYQVDDSATRKMPGAGIGLTLARELVGLMGGNIQVQSKPGEGTDFSVLLPVALSSPKAITAENAAAGTPAAAEQLSADVETPSGEPRPYPEEAAAGTLLAAGEIKKGAASETAAPIRNSLPVVLLIEDDRDVLTYLASCLEGNYQLEFARNGREGIDQALEVVPDLIISDVMMPEKDGYEVCATLKEDIRTSHIPIVLLTAKADQGSRIAGLKCGADAYLSKPFDKEELEVRLVKLLELRRQLQARYGKLQSVQETGERPLSREDRFLQDLRRTVGEYLSDEGFGIAQLCRAVGMSRSQLHQKLRALTGRPASLYIRAIRLEKAKELLRHTDLSISEVAYEVGFRTPVYFTQAFTEEVGVAPSVYRNEK